MVYKSREEITYPIIYSLWEQLRTELYQGKDGVTVPEAINRINRGVGKTLVKKLQEIGRDRNHPESIWLGAVMSREIKDAILNYRDSR
jgi:hypothetical protein